MKKILGMLNMIALTSTISTNVVACLGVEELKQKTQQDTIYIDNNGKQVTTNERDLFAINSKEVIQIGFYKNSNEEIQAVRMPRTIEKVPKQLPAAITSLKNMFSGATIFNQDLSNWDTSNVTNMSDMFNNASLFNGNIAKWNVSNVRDMSSMFRGARSFNKNIAKWNVSNVWWMTYMFGEAATFNGNIAKWNTFNVRDMSGMFANATSFNKNIAKWNVSNVWWMTYMFGEAATFNGNIANWNTFNVRDMRVCLLMQRHLIKIFQIEILQM